MVKVSRPIIYTIVLGAAAYAVVLFTEPETPTRRTSVRTAASSSSSRTARDTSGNITEEDLNAEFPRYAPAAPAARDPFKPGVAAKTSRGGSGVAAVTVDPRLLPLGGGPGRSQTWKLTGISSVNGVRSALVENGRPEDSVFLRTGDRWNGLSVAAVEPDAIVFVNNLGQRTRLTFEVSAPEMPGAAPAPGSGGGNSPQRPAAAAATATAQNNQPGGGRAAN